MPISTKDLSAASVIQKLPWEDSSQVAFKDLAIPNIFQIDHGTTNRRTVVVMKINLIQYNQLGHTVEEEGDPRGDIHTYRMALWAAHFGGCDEAFQNPNTDACREKGIFLPCYIFN